MPGITLHDPTFGAARPHCDGASDPTCGEHPMQQAPTAKITQTSRHILGRDFIEPSRFILDVGV
jgi:hypothetical protein